MISETNTIKKSDNNLTIPVCIVVALLVVASVLLKFIPLIPTMDLMSTALIMGIGSFIVCFVLMEILKHTRPFSNLSKPYEFPAWLLCTACPVGIFVYVACFTDWIPAITVQNFGMTYIVLISIGLAFGICLLRALTVSTSDAANNLHEYSDFFRFLSRPASPILRIVSNPLSWIMGTSLIAIAVFYEPALIHLFALKLLPTLGILFGIGFFSGTLISWFTKRFLYNQLDSLERHKILGHTYSKTTTQPSNNWNKPVPYTAFSEIILAFHLIQSSIFPRAKQEENPNRLDM